MKTKDNRISITVEPKEEDILRTFENVKPEDTLQARFEWFRDHCEYAHIPVTGFVDGHRTAWKLVSVQRYVSHP